MTSYRTGFHAGNQPINLDATSNDPEILSKDKALEIGQTLAGRPALLNFESHKEDLLLTAENLTLEPKVFSRLQQVAAQRNFLYKS